MLLLILSLAMAQHITPAPQPEQRIEELEEAVGVRGAELSELRAVVEELLAAVGAEPEEAEAVEEQPEDCDPDDTGQLEADIDDPVEPEASES